MSSQHVEDQDSWYGIVDEAHRRRLQNRLAQRARRKRLAQKAGNKEIRDGDVRIVTKHQRGTYATTPESSSDESSQSSGEASPILWRSLTTGFTYIGLNLPSAPDDYISTPVNMTVFTAMFQNGAMMGLTCSNNVPGRSLRQDRSIPDSLQPTALQLTTIHVPWIDRFPFAKMRDNFITLVGIIDEEEFLRDLFSMESLRIVPNRPGWDPDAWMISNKFAKKWGYLWY